MKTCPLFAVLSICLTIVSVSYVFGADDHAYALLSNKTPLDHHLKITEVELDPVPTDEFGQWIEVHNPTNFTISSSIAVVQQDQEFPQFVITSTSIEPGEYRVFEIWSKDAPKDEGFLVENSVIVLFRDEKGMDKTPPLTDTFSDSRTWQLNGTEWVFAEETPMMIIPEFPYFISFILFVSMVATIFLTKTKKANGGNQSV